MRSGNGFGPSNMCCAASIVENGFLLISTITSPIPNVLVVAFVADVVIYQPVFV